MSGIFFLISEAGRECLHIYIRLSATLHLYSRNILHCISMSDKKGMIQSAPHLAGCGARYSILDLISSGILAKRLVRVLSITQVLHSIRTTFPATHVCLSSWTSEQHIERFGASSGSGSLQSCKAYLVALPISSFVVTFLMIQFLHAAMRPSSWNHVSICTRSPLHMHQAVYMDHMQQASDMLLHRRHHRAVERHVPSPLGVFMHPDLYPCGGEDQVPLNHNWVCCIACISPAPKRYRMIACHFLHLSQS